MLHSSESHLDTNVFTEGNQSDTDDSSDLMDRLFLVFLMLSAQMEHLLDFQDISRASVCACLNNELTEARRVYIGDHLADLHRGLCCILLSKEKKTET